MGCDIRIYFTFAWIQLYKYLAMSGLDVDNWWLPGEFSHYVYHNSVQSKLFTEMLIHFKVTSVGQNISQNHFHLSFFLVGMYI